MLNEMFKNGVAWYVGATASGAACIGFILDYVKDFFK